VNDNYIKIMPVQQNFFSLWLSTFKSMQLHTSRTEFNKPLLSDCKAKCFCSKYFKSICHTFSRTIVVVLKAAAILNAYKAFRKKALVAFE
jgi:hypothetical protein